MNFPPYFLSFFQVFGWISSKPNQTPAVITASVSLESNLTQLKIPLTTSAPEPIYINGFFNRNGWDEPKVKRSLMSKIIVVGFYTALAVFGITGNGLVIFAIFTDSTVQIQAQLSNMGVLNLAYTDLMTTSIVCIPAIIAGVYDLYPFGFYFCKLWSIFNLCGIVATMGLLAWISFDRWIAIKWSLHYPQYVTYSRFLYCMIAMWVITFACTIGWAYFPVEYDETAGVCDYAFATFGPSNPEAMAYGVFGATVHCIIPSSVILYCNVAIIKMAKGKEPKGGKADKKEKGKEKSEEEKSKAKVFKAMIIVIISYFALTYPVAIMRVVKIMSGREGIAKYIPNWLNFGLTVLQFSASIVNPMIYGLLRSDFRNAYAKIFKNLKAKLSF